MKLTVGRWGVSTDWSYRQHWTKPWQGGRLRLQNFTSTRLMHAAAL